MAKLTRFILIFCAVTLVFLGVIAKGAITETTGEILYYANGENETIQGLAMKLQVADTNADHNTSARFLFVVSSFCLLASFGLWRFRPHIPRKRQTIRKATTEQIYLPSYDQNYFRQGENREVERRQISERQPPSTRFHDP